MASLLFSSRNSLGRIIHNLKTHTIPLRSLHTTPHPSIPPYTRIPPRKPHQPKLLFLNKPFSASYATVVLQNQPRSRSRRILTNLLIGLTSFTVGGYLALSYAPPFLTSLMLGAIPSDADSLLYEAPDDYTRAIDSHIKNHPLALALRANPAFTESRPHAKIPPEIRQHNLTAGTLAGPETVPVPPLCFNEKDGKSMVCIFYVGHNLCGHPGIVHGGFLATMLDEGLARCAFPAMPNKVGVTANLTINYRKPTMAGQFLVLTAKTLRVEGRKAWTEGWIEPLEDVGVEKVGTAVVDEPRNATGPGGRLVEASALFIEPRHAKMLKSLYRQAT